MQIVFLHQLLETVLVLAKYPRLWPARSQYRRAGAICNELWESISVMNSSLCTRGTDLGLSEAPADSQCPSEPPAYPT